MRPGLRDATTKSKVVFWNAAGSSIYAISSFLLLLIVTRTCGEETAGVFSMGYAIAQLMLTVGVFEATTYFATDAGNRFSTEQYFAFKLLTCALMIVVSVIYVATFRYTSYKAGVALALCAFRLLEAFSQFYYAAFQKAERLDISGFSTVWRMVLAMAAFTVVIVVYRDVFWATIAATVVEAIWIALYDMRRLKLVSPLSRPDFSHGPMRALFWQLFPLFVCSFLATYLCNAPKNAIDAVGTEQMQAFFNMLFMPSFVINLFMIFIMRPVLTELADRWVNGDTTAFSRRTYRLLLSVVGITVGVEIVCAFVGIPILNWFFGVDLSGNLVSLLIIMLAGGLSSAASVLYNDMVIMRRQRGILIAYCIAGVFAFLVSSPLVRVLALEGAAYAYLLTCAVLFLAFMAIYLYCLRHRKVS